jgi:hypothetical protein
MQDIYFGDLDNVCPSQEVEVRVRFEKISNQRRTSSTGP